MTEAEWLACDDRRQMLMFLNDKVSERKLRLFACACCRRVWHLLVYEPSRCCVETAERYADGAADVAGLQAAQQRAEHELADAWHGPLCPWHEASAASAAQDTCFVDEEEEAEAASWADGAAELVAKAVADQKVYVGSPYFSIAEGSDPEERRQQVALLRDLVGPLPFRPIGIQTSWQSLTAVSLAQAIYDNRAFDRLPILADALEDAGCDNREILDHCRQPGGHVRGCWVVDLVLGKQ